MRTIAATVMLYDIFVSQEDGDPLPEQKNPVWNLIKQPGRLNFSILSPYIKNCLEVDLEKLNLSDENTLEEIIEAMQRTQL